MGRWVRGSAASAFVAVVALATAVDVVADPGATNVVNVVAVNASGQPINGYHVVDRQVSADLSDCPGSSPAAVSTNIYACDPSEAAAEVCWPAPANVPQNALGTVRSSRHSSRGWKAEGRRERERRSMVHTP